MSTQPPRPPDDAESGTPGAPQYGPSQQGWVAGEPPSQTWAPVSPAPNGPSGPRAGFWQRFGAALIDGLILGAILLLLTLALKAAGYALALLIAVLYVVYFEGGPTGQTIGKRALGIRVVSFSTGGPIGYGRALLRYVGKFISGLFLYLGYFWMLWDREKQCWHDKMATDVVVPVSAYPVGPGGSTGDPSYPAGPFAT